MAVEKSLYEAPQGLEALAADEPDIEIEIEVLGAKQGVAGQSGGIIEQRVPDLIAQWKGDPSQRLGHRAHITDSRIIIRQAARRSPLQEPPCKNQNSPLLSNSPHPVFFSAAYGNP